jgi:hypothetical protein
MDWPSFAAAVTVDCVPGGVAPSTSGSLTTNVEAHREIAVVASRPKGARRAEEEESIMMAIPVVVCRNGREEEIYAKKVGVKQRTSKEDHGLWDITYS